MSWISRVLNTFRGEKMDAGLDEEIRFHIEERIDELVRHGMPAGEARTVAMRKFGGALKAQESSREIKSLVWLDNLIRDFRFGIRMLAKHRGASAAVIVSLGLALGSCLASFALIDALLLRPLPVPEPRQLIDLARLMPGFLSASGQPRELHFFSYPQFRLLRESAQNKADLFAMTLEGGLRPAVFSDAAGLSENIRAEAISGDGFQILGIKPRAGRLIDGKDDQPDSAPIAVLSYQFWKRRFGNDPSALGRTVTIGRRTYLIAGVAAEDFSGVRPGYLTDLWTPLVLSVEPGQLSDPDRVSASVWGRLRSGVGSAGLAAVLQPALTNFLRERVRIAPPRNLHASQLAQLAETPLVVRDASTGRPSLFRARFARPLLILALICALLLLMAAANAATILLARATARDREMALRSSLGASRARLMLQTGVESGQLVALALMLGCLVAIAMAPLVVVRLGPPELPAWLDVRLDYRVLAVGWALSVATVVLIGFTPALRVSSFSPIAALHNGTERYAARNRTMAGMLAVQVGLSIAVLFLSGLLLQSFRKLISVDLGFRPGNVALFDMAPKEAGSRPAVDVHEVLDRVRSLPGVEAASATQQRPMGGDLVWISNPIIRLPGESPSAVRPREVAVSPGFFDALGVRWIAGRDFLPEEVRRPSEAAIVNQTFAERFFPGENPIGKVFEKLTDDPEPVRQQVVGVVANILYNNPREPAGPSIYSPLRNLAFATLNVRTRTDIAPLRKEIESAAPALFVSNVTTLSSQIEDTLLSERLLAMLGAYFSVMAALVAAIGLYGVISHAAARRTREFGIRIALGGSRRSIGQELVSDTALPLALGTVLGTGLGLAVVRHFSPVLYGVTPLDSLSLAAPVVTLLISGLLATVAPVLRAARRDPAVVLRYE
jgi:predicted permease